MHLQRKHWFLVFLVSLVVVTGLAVGFQIVNASGLVDETTNQQHAFSQFPVNNYQLDFYVDTSWDWLPWNWGDGIGQSVMYGIYAITNFIWLVSVYLSYAVGYLIQQAYALDFIKDTTNAIGHNMQLLAGISKTGFSNDGFYPGLILMLILILGIYVAYTGLIKHQASRAISAVINFVVVFIISASFIAYAPDYINKINQFSSDMSTSALNVGSKMIMQDSSTKNESGVNAIRDTIFNIQVKQPWTLLQFGDSDVKKVGAKRINKLVATDPFKNKGKDRTDLVKSEIEDKNNDNLTATKTINRLGIATFIVIFNVIITFFVFMLTATMIFSQILFIIYATFLPLSFLLAMIPSFNGLLKTAILKLFNTIMMRAGVTIVLTLTFCVSTMVYGLTSATPFFLVAFLQIVTFAGIWHKLGDLMGLMQLSGHDSHRGAQTFTRRGHRLLKQVVRNTGLKSAFNRGSNHQNQLAPETSSPAPSKSMLKKGNPRQISHSKDFHSVGQKVGNVLDTKNRLASQANKAKDQLKNLPTNAKYNLKQRKDGLHQGIDHFKQGIIDQKQINAQNRHQAQKQRRAEIQRRQLALNSKQTTSPTSRPIHADLPQQRPPITNTKPPHSKSNHFIKPHKKQSKPLNSNRRPSRSKGGEHHDR